MISDIKSVVESLSVPLPKNWSMTWRSEIQKNYVALSVVCETFVVENYTQNVVMSGIDLLVDVQVCGSALVSFQ